MKFLFKIILILFCFTLSNCSDKSDKIQYKELKSDRINNLINNAKDKSKSLKEKKEALDKAFKLAKNLKDNNLKIKKYHEISFMYYSLNENEHYKEINDKALKISVDILDSLGIAKTYGNLGIYYRYRSIQLDSAYKSYLEADKIYNRFDEKNTVDPKKYTYDHGKVLIDLAKILRKVKDYSESEYLTIKAIKKFTLAKNNTYLPLCYTNLGIISKQLERYDTAVEYHLKSLEYAKEMEEQPNYSYILTYNNIGTVYKSNKKYSKAVDYYKKALSQKEYLKKHPKTYARLLDNLAYAKFLNQDTINVLDNFHDALRIRENINDKAGISTNNLHLAEYYQSFNLDDMSKIYAEKAKNISKELKNNEDLLKSYKILTDISNNAEGLKYAKLHIKLNDSLQREDNLFRDKFARIRFESENLEKENLQRKKEIIEIQNQNTIYFLGIILLITFIGFLIYFSRQRTRYLAQQNKIVEFQTAYETETRISKRLHDEIGNDIFQVMMQYQNDPHDPQITQKLNTAYTKARDISRENSEFEVDETYLEELTDMLTNYTKNDIKLILRGIEKISWDTLDKNLKITIYRVLQELMTNMQKHSKADLVAVVFKNEKKKLIIKYSDNGVGIQKDEIKSKNGLRNTEKRIQAIKGTIIFDSEIDKGFKAEIKIPC